MAGEISVYRAAEGGGKGEGRERGRWGRKRIARERNKNEMRTESLIRIG